MQKTMPLPAAKLPVTATAAAVLAAGLALAGCGGAASSSPAGSATNSATAVATGGTAASGTSAATAAGASASVPFPVGSVNGSAKETYLFHADGSISYPLGSFSPGSGVTVTSNGVVWPPASVIASGKPSQSTLNISIKAAGQTLSTTAHVTVQGAGTATVTGPAGTYQATVVLVTERLSIVGVTASIQVKTWLAPG
jgi:hypothetical protein